MEGTGAELGDDASRPGWPCPPAPSLSIVVPARDEASVIGWTLRSLRAAAADLVTAGTLREAEVVLVDDHSTDGTGAVARAVGREAGPDLVVEATGPTGGLGAAIRRGLAVAGGDLVLYTDADLPFFPGDLDRVIGPALTYDADLVCGYRFDRTAEGRRRAAQSIAYNLLVTAVLPVRVRDVNFACKLLHRRLVDAVLPELRSDGSFIDAELVARAHRLGARTIQVGLDYYPRLDSASTLGGVSAISGILRELRQQAGELRRR